MAVDPAPAAARTDAWQSGPLGQGWDSSYAYVDRMADILIEHQSALHQFSWWTTAFASFGFVVMCFAVFVLGVHWWQTRRENRRLDALAAALSTLAFSELSLAEMDEAQRRWPALYQFAAEICRDSRGRALKEAQARARAELDEWFEAQRDEATALYWDDEGIRAGQA